MKQFFYLLFPFHITNENGCLKVSFSNGLFGLAKIKQITLLVLGLSLLVFTNAVAQKPAASLEQIRNGSAMQPVSPAQWQNGNAGNQTAHYVESHSIGYRALLTGLPANTTVNLILGYDIKHSSKNAIDFLTHYDRLQPHGQFLSGGQHPAQEVVDPRLGTSFAGQAPTSTFEIPRPFGTATTPAGTAYDGVDLAKRLMTLWGGVIEDIQYVTPFADLTAAQSEQRITVRFRTGSTGGAAVLAWGGHIANRLDWGFENGVPLSAGGISGSPYHMRLINWELGNLGNQDRSLSAAAVIPPPLCTLAGADKVCANTDNGYSTTVVADSYSWTLINNTSGATFNPTPVSTSSSVTVNAGPDAGGYTVKLVTTKNGITSTDVCEISATVSNPLTNAVDNRIHCHSASGAAINFTSPTVGATFTWTSSADVGFGTSGAGNIGAYTANNTGNAPVTATVTVIATANDCAGPPRTFTVTVNPSPATNSVGNRVHCAGDAGTAITFSSPTTGATFAWTSTANVGFGTSGSGSIDAYNAVNSTNAPITATISVIASANNCAGPAQTFTVTVNPRPTTDAVDNRIHCHSASGAAINFTSPTTGATFAWTSSADVGFGTSGSSNIGAYTATNTGNAPVTATVTVIATANGCTGPARTFTITVNPSPVTDAVGNRIHCHNAPGAAINFTSSTVGATFTWTSTVNVGFGTSGTGNINAYTATNIGTTPVSAIITVIATANSCAGPARTFTVTVDPSPSTDAVGNRTHCTGEPGAAISFTSPTVGATFAWTSTANVGFGTSGTGNIGAYTATNTGNAPVTATVTVTATANGCAGPARTFTVTVNHQPGAPNVTYIAPACDETTFSVSVNSPTAGATYTLRDKNNNVIPGINSSIATPAGVNPSVVFTSIPAGSGYIIREVSSAGCVSLPNNCGTPTVNSIQSLKTVKAPEKGEEVKDSNLTAYPIPFTNNTTIEFKSVKDEDYVINLYDLKGTLVKQLKSGKARDGEVTRVEVDGSNMAESIYLVRKVSKSGVSTVKLLKKR